MLFLIPGVPLINSIIDMFKGFWLNGITRITRVIFILMAMTAGIVLTMFIYETCATLNYDSLAFTFRHNFLLLAIAGAISAISFSILLEVPKRLLAVVGILCAAGIFIKFLSMRELNFSLEIATLFGATFISVAMIKLRNYINSPMQTLVIPAILPFVPGVLMYRFLFACIVLDMLQSEEFYDALKLGVDAA